MLPIQGDRVAVSVTDQLRGITAGALPNLFQRLRHIHSDDWGQDIGQSGMSLAVCRGSWKITGAVSGPRAPDRRGITRFTFTLPVTEERVISAPTGSPGLYGASREDQQEPPRVLVVDDEPQIMWYVRFDSLGVHQTSTPSNGGGNRNDDTTTIILEGD
jgi:hypothetical protein